MSPRLYIVARPTIAEGMATFFEHHGLAARERGDASAAERLAGFAGRIAHAPGEHPGTRERIAALVAGDESLLAHAVWTFALANVSRDLAPGLARHFAVHTLSRRYLDEVEPEFVQPRGLENSPAALAAWNASIEAAKSAARTIRTELGSASARVILPGAVATILVATANARAIRDFLSASGDADDAETRTVAMLLHQMLTLEAPVLAADFVAEQREDGSPAILRQ